MYSAETLALFRRLLEQESVCTDSLYQALLAERAALTARDVPALEQATAVKHDCLRDMEQWLAAHEGFLAARGLPTGKLGTERFLQELPPNAPEGELWQHLRELARQCHEQNEINGRLLILAQARTQRGLELLRHPRDQARTYGRAGVTQGHGISHLIGRV